MPAQRSYAIPITLFTLGALWCIGMSRTPVPFGSRYLDGGQLETNGGNYDVAYYELSGTDAVDRARSAAESFGYKAKSADAGGVVLEGPDGQITIQRGRFIALRHVYSAGPQAQVDDETRDAAVIAVAQPIPAWRKSLQSRLVGLRGE